MSPFDPNLELLFGDPDAVQVPGPRVLNAVTLAITQGSQNLFFYLHDASNVT
jgi:hypothetical protein